MRRTVLIWWMAGLLSASAVVTPNAWATDTPPERRYGDFLEPGFPFIVSTVDLRKLGPGYPQNNLVSRGIVVTLGHDLYAMFDTDLLRMACVWEGDHIEMISMAPLTYNVANQYGKQPGGMGSLAGVVGQPISMTGVYPGWLTGGLPITDPRPEPPNPDEPGRGPIDDTLGRYTGLHLSGERVILEYRVAGARVLERSRAVSQGDAKAVARTIRIDKHAQPLRIVLAEAPAGARFEVNGNTARLAPKGNASPASVFATPDLPGKLLVQNDRFLVANLNASESKRTFTIYQGIARDGEANALARLAKNDRGAAAAIPHRYHRGGPRHWPGEVRVSGTRGEDTAAYVLDDIALPNPNPWKRNVRTSGMGFFPDGRLVACTYDGDVWIAEGVDDSLSDIRWTRYASGLCEPQSVKVVDGYVYVFGRGGITRLHDINLDGEADFYENFSNLMIQTAETRDFAMDMVAKPGGGFYVCKGGQQAESRGFHNGSAIEISADGRRARLIADGLREPYLGIHPETGVLSASDQQGHYVPSTPVHVVRPGDYFGHAVTTWRSPEPPVTEPLMWIPHHVNSSGTGMVWVTDDRMGPLKGSMLYLSYFVTGVFRVTPDFDAPREQGAVTQLPVHPLFPILKGAQNPADGQAYITGFQMWGGQAQTMAGINRIRYTGLADTQPVTARTVKNGVVLTFERPLELAAAPRPEDFRIERWNYVRSPSYGSGHYRLNGEPGQDPVGVAGVHLSKDRYSVFVHVPDMRIAMQMSMHYRMNGAGGRVYEDAAYFTVHSLRDEDLTAEFGALDLSATQGVVVAHKIETEASIELGKSISALFGCIGCHSVDGTQAGKIGPTWKGLYGSERRFIDGKSERADRKYLVEAIIKPKKKYTVGFPQAMPPYEGVLNDAQVESLIMYIESLK
ncbi:MAG: DUF6797 domain-containing protein [Planctomycetota bacterium]|jgi:cytochrome c2